MRINISVPEGFLDVLDGKRGSMSRSAYIVGLVEGMELKTVPNSFSFSADSGGVSGDFSEDTSLTVEVPAEFDSYEWVGTQGTLGSDFEAELSAFEEKMASYEVENVDDGIAREWEAECKAIGKRYGWQFNQKGRYLWKGEEKRLIKGWS